MNEKNITYLGSLEGSTPDLVAGKMGGRGHSLELTFKDIELGNLSS